MVLCFPNFVQGFRKVDPDRWEFANEGFLRGQKHLLKTISRRKPNHVNSQPQQPQVQNSTAQACVEVGKFGLEEEIERLKRDKNVLMQELVRLRQQQQTTDHQVQTVVKRLQGMEQRQQQMMSFLAKAMHTPGFFAQFVQKNDSNRRAVGGSKKRRLPKQENVVEGSPEPGDGQIVKYKPVMNEAAKAMLLQLLKADTSPRLEAANKSSANKSSDGFSMDAMSSTTEAFKSGNSCRNSGVTLTEVPFCSGPAVAPASSGFSTSTQSSTAFPDIPSSLAAPDVTACPLTEPLFAGIQEPIAPLSPPSVNMPEYPEILVSEGDIVDMPGDGFVLPDVDGNLVDPMTLGVDGAIPIEPDKFDEDSYIDSLLENSSKDLANFEFSWEQFLTASPISGVTDDNPNSPLGIDSKETGIMSLVGDGWTNGQHMDILTEQMGLLTSKP